MGAKLARPDAVMLGGGVHDGAAGQEGLEIEPDMAFGGSLAAAMFGQSSERAINWMVVESTTWMSRLKRKAKRGVRWPPKAGCKVCRCSSTDQKSCSASFGSRVRLACESVFLGAGLRLATPTTVPNASAARRTRR